MSVRITPLIQELELVRSGSTHHELDPRDAADFRDGAPLLVTSHAGLPDGATLRIDLLARRAMSDGVRHLDTLATARFVDGGAASWVYAEVAPPADLGPCVRVSPVETAPSSGRPTLAASDARESPLQERS